MPATAPTRAGAAEQARSIRTTVVLPAYNEAAALPDVLTELAEHLDDSYEVLVIDDGSTDATAEVAEKGPCRLIRHPGNQGKGVAIRTGIAEAKGEYVVIMDADATYPVEAIDKLVQMLDENDLVRGKRESDDESMPSINRVGNWLFNKLFSIAHGLEGGDHLSGLYGLRRDAFRRLGLEAKGFDIETEIGIKAQAQGLRVAEFPIDYLPRVGEKKLSPWRDGFRILGRVIVLLLIYNPVVSFIIPGLLLLTLSLGGAILLSQGDLETQYFGLSIHSFIVAALGVLAAFQLTVFGIAAALYGVEAGKPPQSWLLRMTAQPVRFFLAGGGILMILIASAKLLQLTIQWAGDDPFTNTRALVLATTLLVLGLQVLSAVLFISIFSGRLGAYEERELPLTAPLVSVVVVNYNGGDEVERCLGALAADDQAPAVEVLVVDNASTDGSADVAERFVADHPAFRVLRSPVNRGYAGGVNVGLEEAQGRYVAVLNMDIEVGRGWLRPIVDLLDAKPEAGAACPLVVLRADPGTINAAGQDVNVTGLGFNRLLGKPVDQAGAEPELVSGLWGGAYVIRREIFDQLGGWDESGFLYAEDVQLSWMLQLLGADVYSVPASTVVHDYHLSMDPEKLFLLERNRSVLVLSNQRLGTLALLSPLFAITELMMWGFCLLRGPRFLAAKARTYGWIARHLGWIRGRRAQVRALRQCPDRQILRRLRWGYPLDQFLTLGRERGLEQRREIPAAHRDSTPTSPS